MRWREAWTGGQYSVVRALAGGSLALLLTVSAFAASPFDSLALALAGFCLFIAAGIGSLERFLTSIVATAVAFEATNLSNSAQQYLALWLSAHVMMRRAPYLSLAARKREDPAGGWSMPAWYVTGCWTVFLVSRAVAGFHAANAGQTLLAGIFFFIAALGLFRPVALAAWFLSLLVGLVLAGLGSGSFSAAWFLHLFAFQPAWLPRSDPRSATVFYDGSCGLCHGAVRFLLAEDRFPPVFRIAPLGGETWQREVSESLRAAVPDSVVVVRGNDLLVRSSATIAILEGLGGIWAAIGAILDLLPRTLLDRAYDWIAANRYRWFGRRSSSCPLMPATLRTRLDP